VEKVPGDRIADLLAEGDPCAEGQRGDLKTGGAEAAVKHGGQGSEGLRPELIEKTENFNPWAKIGPCVSRIDLFEARDMAPAFKLSGEPDFHNLDGLILGNGALPDGKAITVVMGAVPDGGLFVPAEAAADAAHAVGDNGFAITRTAEDDAALKLAARDSFGHGADEIRVIGGRRFVVRAEVAHRMTLGEEQGLDDFLIGEAGMVGANGNG
jgi:hypothetical protein